MGIIVRSMVQSDFKAISTAYGLQQTEVHPAVYEKYFEFMRGGEYDVLVAETASQVAGYARIAWYGGRDTDVYMPEIVAFVVFDKFTGSGVAQAMASEAQRRIAERTGELEENVLLAIYCDRPLRLPRSSFVLDGLIVNRDGKFVKRGKEPAKEANLALCISGRPVNPARQL